MVLFDDILVYCGSWELHIAHVKTIFEVLRHHQFFVKLKKCTFGCQEVEYLGHILGRCQGRPTENSSYVGMAETYYDHRA